MPLDLHGAVLRESALQDTEQLRELWCKVFGDPPELVDAFLSHLPGMGCGCVAERDGRILGAAYLIHGFTLLQPRTPGSPRTRSRRRCQPRSGSDGPGVRG